MGVAHKRERVDREVGIAPESKSVVVHPATHFDSEIISLGIHGLLGGRAVARGLEDSAQKHGAVINPTTGPLDQPGQLGVRDIAIRASIVIKELDNCRQGFPSQVRADPEFGTPRGEPERKPDFPSRRHPPGGGLPDRLSPQLGGLRAMETSRSDGGSTKPSLRRVR